MARAKSKHVRQRRSKTAKDWDAELAILQRDLNRIADDFKQWSVRDASRASTAVERADLKRLVEAAIGFGTTWHRIGEHGRANVGARLLEQGFAGEAFVAGVERDLHRIASAAISAQRDIPARGWPAGSRRRAAMQLRDLFEKRRLPYTAHSSEYGGVSLAVAGILKIFALAGQLLSADAARKLIEEARR